MKSEELQILTASEPLSLEEEYAMQKSWLMDENSSVYGLMCNKKITDLFQNALLLS